MERAKELASERARVRLRYMEPADAQALFCMENDPEVWRYSEGSEAPYTWEQIEGFVLGAPRDLAVEGQLRLVIEYGGRVAGAVDLYGYDGREAWVGVLVWPGELRGRGVGVAALGALVEWARKEGIEVLRAQVGEGNEGSRRLFAGAGFEEVGGGEFALRLVSET